MAHDVFISYDFDDRDAATRIRAQLEAHGVRCWMAPDSIAPGVDYAEAITGAIQSSSALLVIFGENTSNSVGVRRELHLADDRGKQICAAIRISDLRLDGSLGYLLSGVQWIDVRSPEFAVDVSPILRRLRELAPLAISFGLPPLPIGSVPRPNLVREVERLLESNGGVALAGYPGAGKSTLARLVAHAAVGASRPVFWLPAEGVAQLSQSLVAAGRALGYSGDPEAIESACIADLRARPDALLVLDNALSPEDMGEKISQLRAKARILLTTQDRAWREQGWGLLDVPEFTPDEAEDFLLAASGSSDRPIAAQLAKDLGFLPLAVAQAAAYIRTTKSTLPEYAQLLRAHPDRLLAEGPLPDRRESFIMTLELALVRLPQESRQLLFQLSIYAPGDLPVSYLRNIDDPVAWDLAFARLVNLSLAERHHGNVSTHRLVRDWLRRHLGDRRIPMVNAALQRLPALLAPGSLWLDYWDRVIHSDVLDHLVSILEIADGADPALLRTAYLTWLPDSRPHLVAEEELARTRRIAEEARLFSSQFLPSDSVFQARIDYLLATFWNLDTHKAEYVAALQEILLDLRASGQHSLPLEIQILCNLGLWDRQPKRIEEALSLAQDSPELREHAERWACIFVEMPFEVDEVDEREQAASYEFAKHLYAHYDFDTDTALDLRTHLATAAWAMADFSLAVTAAAEALTLGVGKLRGLSPRQWPTSLLGPMGILVRFAFFAASDRPNLTEEQRQIIAQAHTTFEDTPELSILATLSAAVLDGFQLELPGLKADEKAN